MYIFLDFVLKPGIMMFTWYEGHIRSNMYQKGSLFIKKLKYFKLFVLFAICHTPLTSLLRAKIIITNNQRLVKNHDHNYITLV